jgi:predicted HD phosphohydrolase
MCQPVQLSIEQEFNVRAFEVQVDQMSLEQAQAFLKNLYRKMVVQETMYKQLLKQQWHC